MRVLFIVSQDGADGRATLCDAVAQRFAQQSSRYSAEVARVDGAGEVRDLRRRAGGALVHLCGDTVPLLGHVVALGPPVLAWEARGAKLPRMMERLDCDLVHQVDLPEDAVSGRPTGGAASSGGSEGDAGAGGGEDDGLQSAVRMLEEQYDRLLESAGLPVPENAAGGGEPSTARERPLRIFFVTQEDPFYLPLFFREFFRIAGLRRRLAELGDGAGQVEVAGIMIQRPLGNKTKKGLLKRMWRLYGPIGFVRQGVRYLFAKILPWRRGVAEEAAHARVRRIELNDANSEEFVSLVERESIDLVVSVSASQIFKAPILNAPRLGCINLHNAPLPHYRGMLPNFWQMYHDEPESVLTVHYMAEDLDKGDILAQRATPIEPDTSLEQLIRRTKIRSARTLWNVLDRFAAGTAVASPLPAEKGSYFTWPTAEEAREFRRRGKRLL